MSSSITLSRSGKFRSRQLELSAACSSHPNSDWLPSEIVRHVVAVHHVNLRDILGELQEQLPRLTRFAALRGSRWDSVLQRFVKLHDALLSSLEWEASEVFPQLLHWQEVGRQHPPPSVLIAACKLAERSHAWCLHVLWQLLRRTRDEMPVSAGAEVHHSFLDRLVALTSEYEQHLFEVECLLLPIIGGGMNQH
jgi:iron-sulfur cluster repair protein YtfE (RIC family)